MKKNYLFIISIAITLLMGYNSHAQTIIAAQDDFAYLPTGAPGQYAIANILANDVIDGHTPSLSDVTITTLYQTSQFVDIENGSSVAVAFPGPTPSGTYIIVYRITSIANPATSATAIARVVIGDCGVPAPIVTAVSAPTCGTLNNGTVSLSGLPSGSWILNVYDHDGDLTQITGGTSTAVIGDLMPFSNYTFSVYDPLADCTSPSVEILTPEMDCGFAIDALSTYQDYNADGLTNPGDMIHYQFSVSNAIPAGGAISDISMFFYTPYVSATISGGTLPVLENGTTNNTTFTGARIITQEDINLGYVRDYISASGTHNSTDVAAAMRKDTWLQINDAIKFVAFIDNDGDGIKIPTKHISRTRRLTMKSTATV